ncbi:MAG: hypothetical protein H0U45_11315 [Tatlockia sp.]|nr:hypothetical protein [Tatlockia sp.]
MQLIWSQNSDYCGLEHLVLWVATAIHAIDVQPQEWIAIDGKSIKGTVTDYGTAYQNFVSLVSLYSSLQGVVLVTQ